MNEEQREAKRLKDIMLEAGVSEGKRKLLDPVADNVACMKLRLDRARELMEDTDVAIAYDNGGGQTGLRENPVYKGYESLWKSYMVGLEKILNAIPEAAAKQIEVQDKPATVLELVRSKHKEA